MLQGLLQGPWLDRAPDLRSRKCFCFLVGCCNYIGELARTCKLTQGEQGEHIPRVHLGSAVIVVYFYWVFLLPTALCNLLSSNLNRNPQRLETDGQGNNYFLNDHDGDGLIPTRSWGYSTQSPSFCFRGPESTGWEVDVTEEYHKQAASPRRQKGRVQLGC